MALVTPMPKYRVVFLGDQSVGKTSIIKRLMFDKFDTAYDATIGVDFFSKTMYLEDRTVRLQLWDTAGQERFRSLIPSYIRDSSVAVIVYDVASRQSFLNTTMWIEEVRREQQDTDIIVVLVGNNVDIVDKRQVSVEEGDEKGRELGAIFIETSAKARFNIKLLFQTIAALPGTKTLLSKKQESMLDQKEDMDGGKHKDFMEVEDQRPPSSLKKKKTEENQEVEGQCHYGRIDGQRCEEMLKRIVEMQEGNRRVEERIKEVESMAERGRLDDIKRWEDMSKRLADMQDGIFKRLEELHRRKELDMVGYKKSYEPLKILRHKEGETDVHDVVCVTKLNKRKRDDKIEKMEEDKDDLNPLN